MATSSPLSISHICSRIVALKPMSVLDVGIGFGKYGVLAREYTDAYRNRHLKSEWQARIDGIEGFKNFVLKFHHHVYDNIYVGDACELVHTLDNYDLILCVDMLEHVAKDKGKLLVKGLIEKGKVVIVCVPVKPAKQGKGKYNNPFDPHRAVWGKEDLLEYGEVTSIEGFNKAGKFTEMFYIMEAKR